MNDYSYQVVGISGIIEFKVSIQKGLILILKRIKCESAGVA
jgi:hypothetical protein